MLIFNILPLVALTDGIPSNFRISLLVFPLYFKRLISAFLLILGRPLLLSDS